MPPWLCIFEIALEGDFINTLIARLLLVVIGQFAIYGLFRKSYSKKVGQNDSIRMRLICFSLSQRFKCLIFTYYMHSDSHLKGDLSKVSLRIQARPKPPALTKVSKPSQSISIMSSRSLLGTHSHSDLSPSLVLSNRSLVVSLESGAPRPSLPHAPSGPILRKTVGRETVGKRVSFTVEESKAGLRHTKARVKSKLLIAHHSHV